MKIKVLSKEKLFQMCTHFLYCSVLSLGGKVNTRRMSQPDMESIFTKINCEIFWSKLNAFIFLGYETNTDASILVCKFHPERTGFNMYAEYTRATTINFPCISTLPLGMFYTKSDRTGTQANSTKVIFFLALHVAHL